MQRLLISVGRAGGIVGVILCALAVAVRLRGIYEFAGFQTGTLLLGGIAAMVAGCLGYLAAIAERDDD